MVEARGKQAVEEQIHEAFFPGVNIEGALFPPEIPVQGDSRAEGEGFLLQGAMDCSEVLRTAAREIVEIFLVR